MKSKGRGCDHRQRAQGSAEHLWKVETRHILDHLAAAPGNRSVGENQGDPDQEISHASKLGPTRAKSVGGNDSAKGGELRTRRIERQPLVVLRHGRLQLRQGHPRFDGNHQVAGGVLDQLRQAVGVDHRIQRLRRGAERHLGAASHEGDSQLLTVGPPKRLACLGHRPGSVRPLGNHPQNGPGHPRPASPLVSRACGTYLPPRSPQSRGVGKTFPGLKLPFGSNAQRSKFIAAKSASLNNSPI